jgi:drug/metabolite transporter (DMT)-like permease
MTPLAVTLVGASAVLHAVWNLLGKRQNPSAAFFFIATLAAVVALSPLLAYRRQMLAMIPPSVWLLIVASAIFEAVYYTGLAGAYRNGDMSLVYPLVRALPVLMITAVTEAFGIGQPIGLWGLLGIAAVAAGCLILPMHNLGELKLSNYLHRWCLLAVLAAVGTSGYTIIDNEALSQLRSLPGTGMGALGIAVLYLALTSVIIACFMGIAVALYQPENAHLRELRRTGMSSAIATGLIIAMAYSLVLGGMAFASNVSYIAAFRQLSIPLGAMLGIGVQKEPLTAPKLVGTAIALAGLILVAV